ncbi:hypothetical protein RFX69_01625, partial [Acinetobacter sp. 148]|nr:hypothetical protein [Acinetobacter sp. 148]
LSACSLGLTAVGLIYGYSWQVSFVCAAGFVIYAELSGDFPLGDSRQPIYKSLRPFDLVS